MDKFDDVRSTSFFKNKILNFTGLDEQKIKTLTFNERTIFPKELVKIKESLLEKGKNPGFGIRKLHEQGIDGTNVTVAIIDLPMLLTHPEYKGKIIAYKNFDDSLISPKSSMHGPAVTSMLVGNTTGTAPGSNVVYAAVPSWKCNQKTYIDAVDWIISINETLPAEKKIRVISISASPPSFKETGGMVTTDEEYQTNLIEWKKVEKRALDNNILIISSSTDKYNFSSCYYDIESPDDMSLVTPGYPDNRQRGTNFLLLPTSLRTVAEERFDSRKSYAYYGKGGISWGIPYLCGCLAMAWQIDPSIKADEIMQYVLETGINNDNDIIINPVGFIDKIQKLSKSKNDDETHEISSQSINYKENNENYNSKQSLIQQKKELYEQLKKEIEQDRMLKNNNIEGDYINNEFMK